MSEAPASPLRRPAQRTHLWVIAVGACALLVLVIFEFFVRSYVGQRIEHAMFHAAEHQRAAFEEGGFVPHWLLNLSIAIPALFFVIITLVRQRFIAAGIAVATFVAANITTQLLKNTFLERPDLSSENGVPWLVNSMPSGHTTLAAGAAVAVFLVSAPRQRPLLGFLVAFFATAVGAITFIETWHRPSDIISAYLVVGAWGLIGGWLIMRAEERWNTVTLENDTSPGGAAGLAWFLGVILTGASALCFLFAGGADGVLAVTDERHTTSAWHWVAGILLSVGPGFLIAGAGINFFDSEIGRRMRGHPLPTPQKLTYPVPPQFAHLYEV
ncbi:phosphatase PAP2 family protein [Nesterenkonia cremea]|uniref:phosphatase PAP2 family protein n=1 Tax=Nesterenkonia cremea TaxID=1882340 RepID=UPI0016686124|nr:phosphatase PAP2 family protein [Nesterenkonia cremea]